MFRLPKNAIIIPGTFSFMERVIGLWFVFFGFQFLSAQLFVKDDVLKVQKGTVIYADTIIQVQNEINKEETRKKTTAIYIVKGTLISEVHKLENAEVIILSDQKSSQKKSSESTVSHLSKKDKIVKESNRDSYESETKNVRDFPQKNQNLLRGNLKPLQISTTSQSKEQLRTYKVENTFVNVLFYDNKKWGTHSIEINGFDYFKSLKSRPPPIIC